MTDLLAPGPPAAQASTAGGPVSYRRRHPLRWLVARIPFRARRARLASTKEMAAIHRLAARIATSNLPRIAVLLGGLIDFLCWPAMAWSRLKKVDPAVWTVVAKEMRRSIAAQKFATWWDCAWLGFPPDEYFAYGLYRPELRKAAGDYLIHNQSLDIYHTLFLEADTAQFRLLSDKAAFCDWCRESGLPTALLLAVASNGGLDFREPPDGPAWDGDIVMKPQRGSNGIGFYRWLKADDGRYRGALGETLTLTEIFDQIRAFSQRRPILVQQRLVNDASTAPFTGGGLATVRVVTARHASGEIEVIAAAIKMPVGAALVDNFMRGNVIAQIDVGSGRMMAGQNHRQRFVPIDRHPDSSAVFAGKTAPQWEAIQRVAAATHRSFPSYVLLAFDIAPTDAGPAIVEANTRGDLRMVQYPGGRPMGLTAYPRVVLSHLADRASRGRRDLKCFG